MNGKDYNVLQINVIAATTTPTPITTVPTTLANVMPIPAASVDHYRQINFTPMDNPTPMQAMDGPFFFNDSTFNMNRIDQSVSLNDVEIWTLVNQTMVAHPFHIHDVQFFILDINGVAPAPEKAGRKDVVSVGPMDTVRFIAVFEDFSGTTPYMYHCHNLMHEDGGMMGQFTVTNNTSIQTIDQKEIDLNIFPNPATSNVSIQINDDKIEVEQVIIYDVLGRKQLENLNPAAQELLQVDVSELNPGTYFIVIRTNEGEVAEKIIKE